MSCKKPCMTQCVMQEALHDTMCHARNLAWHNVSCKKPCMTHTPPHITTRSKTENHTAKQNHTVKNRKPHGQKQETTHHPHGHPHGPQNTLHDTLCHAINAYKNNSCSTIPSPTHGLHDTMCHARIGCVEVCVESICGCVVFCV